MEWTPSAKSELERLLLQARDQLGGEGADPEEVSEDLRRHVEAEMAAVDATVITAEDVRRLLLAMGVPVADDPEPRPAGGTEAPLPPRPLRQRPVPPAGADHPPAVRLFLFGVALPAAAIVVELSTRICATSFFDPFPTPWHVAFFGSIVVASLALLVFGFAPRIPYPRLLGGLVGFALGAAMLYGLRFLPIIPFSLLALVIGFGFLSLSPYTALWSLASGTGWLRRRVEADGLPPLGTIGWGLGIAVVFAVLIEVSPVLTRVGLKMAVDPDPARRTRGIALLRNWGNDDRLLRACYQREGGSGDLLGFVFAFSRPPTPEEARAIYYRTTGVPFNALPRPRMSTRTPFAFDDDFVWEEQGGDVVGGRVSGLHLASSRLDGSIDAAAALAYTEWTLEFENLSSRAQEARAQIALPAGGVVSRLTLWVHGVEREAVFAQRNRVTRAYQGIVERRRDPVLVRTSGPDRVLVQCFPVPVGGERMKIRLGITAPLALEGRTQGFLAQPCFVERNFDVPETAFHAVWWESHSPVDSAGDGLQTERPEDDVYAVRGRLTDRALRHGEGLLTIERSARVRRAWTPDAKTGDDHVIVQDLVESPTPLLARPRALAVVVDGSRLMADPLAEVANVLEHLPPDLTLDVFVAREEAAEALLENGRTEAATLRAVAERLRGTKARGGCDAAPALLAACEAVAKAPDGLVLWIFGPQPVELGSSASLTQFLDRRPNGAAILAMPAVRGPNRTLEALDGYAKAAAFPRRGALASDLERLVDAWRNPRPGILFQRARIPSADFTPGGADKRTSLHLVKLWAKDGVNALLALGRRGETAAAQEIGATYQIVTPVTGAVVLETDEQYVAAGLVPPNGEGAEVPTIPEPETIALLIAVGLLLLATVVWQRRRASGATA